MKPVRSMRLVRRLVMLATVAAAIGVWNSVFDRSVVQAGRDYVVAADAAAHAGGPYARMDDWMQPAVHRGVRSATLLSAVVLIVGFAGVWALGRIAGRGAPGDGKRGALGAAVPRGAGPGAPAEGARR